MSHTVDKDTFQAAIMTPESVVWEGHVTAVESTNSEGEFSILPDHARFITILNAAPIVFYMADGSTETFTYDTAVLSCADNQLTIFVHATVVP